MADVEAIRSYFMHGSRCDKCSLPLISMRVYEDRFELVHAHLGDPCVIEFDKNRVSDVRRRASSHSRRRPALSANPVTGR